MAREDDEPAVVPRAVVADVVAQQGFDVGELGVPEGEVPDQPLAVGPDVVVFGVAAEHGGEEGELGGGEGGDVGHYCLAVVPVLFKFRKASGEGMRWKWGGGKGYQIW